MTARDAFSPIEWRSSAFREAQARYAQRRRALTFAGTLVTVVAAGGAAVVMLDIGPTSAPSPGLATVPIAPPPTRQERADPPAIPGNSPNTAFVLLPPVTGDPLGPSVSPTPMASGGAQMSSVRPAPHPRTSTPPLASHARPSPRLAAPRPVPDVPGPATDLAPEPGDAASIGFGQVSGSQPVTGTDAEMLLEKTGTAEERPGSVPVDTGAPPVTAPANMAESAADNAATPADIGAAPARLAVADETVQHVVPAATESPGEMPGESVLPPLPPPPPQRPTRPSESLEAVVPAPAAIEDPAPSASPEITPVRLTATAASYTQIFPSVVVGGRELGSVTVRDFGSGFATVHLGGLLGLFKLRMPPAEFARLAAAPAADAFVGLEELRASGLTASYDPRQGKLTLAIAPLPREALPR